MKSEKQNGIILASTTVFLLILGSLTLLTLGYKEEIFRLKKQQIISSKVAEKEFKKTVSSLISGTAIHQAGVEIFGEKLKLYTKAARPALIGTPSLTGLLLNEKNVFPQFDMAGLYQQSQICLNGVPQTTALTMEGRNLTPGTFWPSTCLIDPASGPVTNLQTKSNISAQNLSFTPSDKNTHSMLFTPGFLEVSGKLTAEDDLIVITGGDIFIGTLEVKAQRRLTLVSTGGFIHVNQISGVPAFKIISKMGHYISGESVLQSEPLLPQMLGRQTISMRWK